MSYMESAMQDQIDGALHLQNAICDDACNIYKQTGIMPFDMKMQRDELLEALKSMKLRVDSSKGINASVDDVFDSFYCDYMKGVIENCDK